MEYGECEYKVNIIINGAAPVPPTALETALAELTDVLAGPAGEAHALAEKADERAAAAALFARGDGAEEEERVEAP